MPVNWQSFGITPKTLREIVRKYVKKNPGNNLRRKDANLVRTDISALKWVSKVGVNSVSDVSAGDVLNCFEEEIKLIENPMCKLLRLPMLFWALLSA